MKTKRVLSAILSVFLLVPCAFAQKEDKGIEFLNTFQDALREDGFDVTLGAGDTL